MTCHSTSNARVAGMTYMTCSWLLFLVYEFNISWSSRTFLSCLIVLLGRVQYCETSVPIFQRIKNCIFFLSNHQYSFNYSHSKAHFVMGQVCVIEGATVAAQQTYLVWSIILFSWIILRWLSFTNLEIDVNTWKTK